MAVLGSLPAGTVVTTEEIVSLNTSQVDVVQVGINVTAASGTSPSLQPYLEVLGADGVWYQVWKPTAITATGQTFATFGPGESNGAVFTATARLRLEATGTTPSFTLSASINGKSTAH